ncbi:crosslink repair DNA glycosylase YcaQ family protein [Nocardiopsis alba]|uniref:DNA glycosylase AlkZ-like family protein n=1 Tax=Nocardiopsis alba TaxID=53437 RepID=UPI0033E01229
MGGSGRGAGGGVGRRLRPGRGRVRVGCAPWGSILGHGGGWAHRVFSSAGRGVSWTLGTLVCEKRPSGWCAGVGGGRPVTVLGVRALNRAMLARQSLLERSKWSVPEAVGRELVRRYLAAFGPATTADVRAWCGLAGLPAAVRELEPELVSFRDEWGRRLWDLEQAPRPDPDTPAPVRFLPAFDNAILGYRDRSRVIDEAHLGLSVAGQRAVLVDGRAAATWTYGRGWLEVAPLRPLSRAEREGVEAEGWMLAGFLEEGVERVRILKAG